VFGTCTNHTNGEVFSTVMLTISNTGPALDYVWSWLECRRKDDQAPLDLFRTPDPGRAWMALDGYTSTNMTLQADRKLEDGFELLFCGAIHWRNAEPPLRQWMDSEPQLRGLAKWLDQKWPHRSAPWHRIPESGDAYTSNIAVEEYFRSVYAIDRARCQEEDAAEAAAKDAEMEERRKAFDEYLAGRGPRPSSSALPAPVRTVRDEIRARFHDYLKSARGPFGLDGRIDSAQERL
jgi:hypothetical protein